MIRQLRPFYTLDELAEVYAAPYRHDKWADHVERVAETAQLVDEVAEAHDAWTMADLSCGDGAIVNSTRREWTAKYLGDFVGDWDYVGPIEATIEQIPAVDVFVLSETLEHVENPVGLLAAIREKARVLLLTTPHDEQTDENHEHYWSWDRDGIRELLVGAGWDAMSSRLWTAESSDYYTFQFWVAS